MAEYILVHGIRVAKSFTPETFGRLTTIGPKFRLSDKRSWAYQVCQCECGTCKVVATRHLKEGSTTSCGCLRKERIIAVKTTHGLSRTLEYSIWYGMIGRCQNPNHSNYSYYGGRGIKVCNRWRGDSGFQNFIDDLGPRPSDNHSIDRIDVNGDYCPENCRWATIAMQATNKRNSRYLEYNGKTQTVGQWAKEFGMAATTLKSRLLSGRSVEDALTRPIRQISKRGPNG
jgi:hypothetical protein